MTKQISIFILMALIAACGNPGGTNESTIPEDLDGLIQMKKELDAQAQTLKEKLETINERIEEISPSKKSVVLVTSDTVQKEDFKHFVHIQSTIEAEEVAKLSPEMGGRLIAINVEEGHPVRKGQLVAQVDGSQLTKQMEELETPLGLARDVFQRQKKLWDQKIGSEIQFLEAKNNVERLEKSKASLQNQITKTRIVSPINGVVETVFNEVGEMAAPGYPVIQIVDVRNLKVVADLPENYLTAVKKGDKVQIHISALDQDLEGRIHLIGQTIDPSNRTFKVEAKINNADHTLKPNLLAEMRINDYTVKEVLFVSTDLIQQEVGGKNFVYIAQNEAGHWKAKKVYVKLGESGDNKVIIKEGLNPSDILIVDGAFNVTEGSEVAFQ